MKIKDMSAPCLCPYCKKWFDVDLDGGFDDKYNNEHIICKKCYESLEVK